MKNNYYKKPKKNHNNKNYFDSKVNHGKILKVSYHDLKYQRKVNFRNPLKN